MFGSKKRGLLHMLANVLALDKEKQNAQQSFYIFPSFKFPETYLIDPDGMTSVPVPAGMSKKINSSLNEISSSQVVLIVPPDTGSTPIFSVIRILLNNSLEKQPISR